MEGFWSPVRVGVTAAHSLIETPTGSVVLLAWMMEQVDTTQEISSGWLKLVPLRVPAMLVLIYYLSRCPIYFLYKFSLVSSRNLDSIVCESGTEG